MIKQIEQFIQKYTSELFLALLGLSFSTWLMASTFSYANGTMYIATKAWSDFASHIPLIRSFTYGSNFPPQYPLFAGPHIKYHFLLYCFVGFLEKLGVRIDIGLNTLSILGFFGLLVAIYSFSFALFQKRSVSILSVLFFLFNGSLSFLLFFQKHPLSWHSFSDIISAKDFASFGPYDHGIVSAFWNLNIYTNQRHLAASYALSLFLIFWVFSSVLWKRSLSVFESIGIGIILAASFFLNIAVFLITGVVLGMFFLLFSRLRKPLLIALPIAAVLAYPQYRYIQAVKGAPILVHIGYLIAGSVTILSFFQYWIANIGLHVIFIPVGLFFSPKSYRKLFLSVFILFLIANIFQFSPEVAANHKFFNYVMVFGGMFSAFGIVRIWEKRELGKVLAIIAVIFLLLSGIFDLFPIANDTKIGLPDLSQNPDAAWIVRNTSPHAVFLSTNYLYDAASLAGRKLYLGWPYFSWSQGYDTTTRSTAIKSALSSNNKPLICRFLQNNSISYVSLTTPSEDFPFTKSFWDTNFEAAYTNKANSYSIYRVASSCQFIH